MPGRHAYLSGNQGLSRYTHLGHWDHPLPVKTRKSRARAKPGTATAHDLNVYMNMQLLVYKSLHESGRFSFFYEIVVV
jgi:hypothetical protein